MKTKMIQVIAVSITLMTLLIPILIQLKSVHNQKQSDQKHILRVVFIQEHKMVDMSEAAPYITEKIDAKQELASNHKEYKDELRVKAREDYESYLAYLEQQRRASQAAQVTYSEPVFSGTASSPMAGESRVYHVTGYVATGNPCASGVYPEAGITVASNSLPLGTKVYIEGIGERVVQDTGGMANNVIDVFVNSTDEAYQLTGDYEVYIVE